MEYAGISPYLICAKPKNEPEDKREGDRRGEVVDPEGFWCSLSQHVRDVPPEEWGGEIA